MRASFGLAVGIPFSYRGVAFRFLKFRDLVANDGYHRKGDALPMQK